MRKTDTSTTPTRADQLRKFFDDNGIAYREFSHSPEGRRGGVSELRGNDLRQAAKAMVIMVN